MDPYFLQTLFFVSLSRFFLNGEKKPMGYCSALWELTNMQAETNKCRRSRFEWWISYGGSSDSTAHVALATCIFIRRYNKDSVGVLDQSGM